MKVARCGDNTPQVAVPEGDKVEAEIKLRYSVYGYGIGDLAVPIHEVSDAEADRLTAEYDDSYDVSECLRLGGSQRRSLREAARIELGLRQFLEDGGFKAFTDTFEDLHGLEQLLGTVSQGFPRGALTCGLDRRTRLQKQNLICGRRAFTTSLFVVLSQTQLDQ